MTTGLDVEDRRSSVLDAFASAAPRENLPATIASSAAAPERAIGAQAVAVYRDEGVILQKLKTLGAAAGQDWYYRFPVRNRRENTTNWIEGPSIKLANDLARIYGNCEVETRVTDLGNEWLIYARFTDFETGFTMTRPFQQRKGQRSVGGDEARALDIALQIGVSKAIRNVVVNALQTFADFAFEEARNALVDKIGKNLPGYRERVVARLSEKGIDLKRVEPVIGRTSGEWLAPDIARVIAMMKSIEDGMATLDDTFPQVAKDEAAPADKTTDVVDEFANGKISEARSGEPKSGEPKNEDVSREKTGGAAEGQGVAPDGGQAATATQPNPEKIALLERLRPKAAKGVASLTRALGGLSAEERGLLAEADTDGLRDAAEAADGAGQGGGRG